LAAGVSTSPRADAVSAMWLLVCSLVVKAACPRGIAQGGAAGPRQMAVDKVSHKAAGKQKLCLCAPCGCVLVRGCPRAKMETVMTMEGKTASHRLPLGERAAHLTGLLRVLV
jgi:hypothetical protein